jgi:Hexameric tyrosine-coordinated heme protein (HTHP)
MKFQEDLRLVPDNTLITETPEQGRQLAVQMARSIVQFTQPDGGKREELRRVYADDPAMLIAISQVVATEFATIAAANNYWRR